MNEIPETRDSLIVRIKSPENRVAWEEFVEIYRPVVYGVATSRGLQHADALDLVQTVFVSIASSISRWEKLDRKSQFRKWVLRVAKNATINALTRRPQDRALGGEGFPTEHVERMSLESPSETELELEYQRQLYLRAADQVKSRVTKENWSAFQMTAIDGISIEQASIELGKSVGAIYATRSRIMKQLSNVVSQLEDSYK